MASQGALCIDGEAAELHLRLIMEKLRKQVLQKPPPRPVSTKAKPRITKKKTKQKQEHCPFCCDDCRHVLVQRIMGQVSDQLTTNLPIEDIYNLLLSIFKEMCKCPLRGQNLSFVDKQIDSSHDLPFICPRYQRTTYESLMKKNQKKKTNKKTKSINRRNNFQKGKTPELIDTLINLLDKGLASNEQFQCNSYENFIDNKNQNISNEKYMIGQSLSADQVNRTRFTKNKESLHKLRSHIDGNKDGKYRNRCPNSFHQYSVHDSLSLKNNLPSSIIHRNRQEDCLSDPKYLSVKNHANADPLSAQNMMSNRDVNAQPSMLNRHEYRDYKTMSCNYTPKEISGNSKYSMKNEQVKQVHEKKKIGRGKERKSNVDKNYDSIFSSLGSHMKNRKLSKCYSNGDFIGGLHDSSYMYTHPEHVTQKHPDFRRHSHLDRNPHRKNFESRYQQKFEHGFRNRLQDSCLHHNNHYHQKQQCNYRKQQRRNTIDSCYCNCFECSYFNSEESPRDMSSVDSCIVVETPDDWSPDIQSPYLYSSYTPSVNQDGDKEEITVILAEHQARIQQLRKQRQENKEFLNRKLSEKLAKRLEQKGGSCPRGNTAKRREKSASLPNIKQNDLLCYSRASRASIQTKRDTLKSHDSFNSNKETMVGDSKETDNRCANNGYGNRDFMKNHSNIESHWLEENSQDECEDFEKPDNPEDDDDLTSDDELTTCHSELEKHVSAKLSCSGFANDKARNRKASRFREFPKNRNSIDTQALKEKAKRGFNKDGLPNVLYGRKSKYGAPFLSGAVSTMKERQLSFDSQYSDSEENSNEFQVDARLEKQKVGGRLPSLRTGRVKSSFVEVESGVRDSVSNVEEEMIVGLGQIHTQKLPEIISRKPLLTTLSNSDMDQTLCKEDMVQNTKVDKHENCCQPDVKDNDNSLIKREVACSQVCVCV